MILLFFSVAWVDVIDLLGDGDGHLLRALRATK